MGNISDAVAVVRDRQVARRRDLQANTFVRLDEKQLSFVRTLSEECGIDRAEVIRVALDHLMQRELPGAHTKKQ